MNNKEKHIKEIKDNLSVICSKLNMHGCKDSIICKDCIAESLYWCGFRTADQKIQEFSDKVIKEIDSWGETADTSMLIDFVKNVTNEYIEAYKE